ncbi:MAG TPA: beta-glucosidase BglX [Acidobacteriaceae bacterium]|nr:beta-glucosidase BglX [Acidobacteriaceae bacterium]
MRVRVVPSLLMFSAIVIVSSAAATYISAPWSPVSAHQVTQPIPTPPSDAEARAFADKLIARMTLAEKLGQMTQVPLNSPPPRPADELARTGAVGSFLFITDAAEINRLQHVAVEQSRLHIPLLFGYDVIHGFRTIYPIPLALAASWNPSAAEQAQTMAAREARATGIAWTFAPMVDIARDPRWGRILEGAGEDPFLGSRMAEAQVRGFQGNDLASPNHIMACVKHFAGYGAASGGRDYEESNISDEQLWNVYLPPFHAALEAGAGSVMSAYMDLNGVPASGNHFLLHDVLRDEWNFRGMVVSDWASVKSLSTHGFAQDDTDAAVRALNAGVNMEMSSTTFRDTLTAALHQGLVTEATINNAVRNILIAKYKLGLFKNPYSDPSQTAAQMVTPEQRATTRKIATQTAVLLRDENNLLPLSSNYKTIALIGPLADSKPDIMGSWCLAGHPSDTVTVLEGLHKRFDASAKILYTRGVEIEREQPSIFDEQFSSPKPTLTTDAERDVEFHHAIDLINQSDVAVLVLGELQSMSGERASRSSLDLPGKQEQLLEAAVATGKPVVLVLLNARPLNITWASKNVPAILEAWYPGTEGGNAIADLLSGDANPGGKLPVAWPLTIGQIPINYACNLTQIPEAPNTRYWDGSSAPLYPFGYGLSYSTFSVSNLHLATPTVHAGSTVQVSIDVQNTSNRAGDEVVQLYTHQRAGSASRPVRELKGFLRVSLAPHETRTVTLPLNTKDLGFWSPQTHHWSMEPGTFDLWAGTDETATNHTTFNLLP